MSRACVFEMECEWYGGAVGFSIVLWKDPTQCLAS